VGLSAVFNALHFPQLFVESESRQVWRWLTPIFLHFSVMHIGFNLLWWWILGKQIEVRQGSGFLFLLMLITGIGSNFSQYLVSGVEFGGLSGVVYALAGYVWLFGVWRPAEGLVLPSGIMVQLIIWLLLGFTGWLSALVGHMANAAHLSGLLLGLWAALLMIAMMRLKYGKR
jgi:GlpG protein